MLIYTDIITGDEMISDSYDLKLVDGIVYEADCAMIEEGAVSIGTFLIRSTHWLLTTKADLVFFEPLQTLVPTPPPREVRRLLRMPPSRSTTLSTPSVSPPPPSTRRAILAT